MAEGKLFLVRHGATSLNNTTVTSQDRVSSWTDHPLSPEGRQDAVRAARELSDYPVKLVLSSDLKRGEQTAAVIAKVHAATRRASGAFRSWNLGDLSGKPFTEAAPVIRRYAGECPNRPVPGGESFEQFKARLLPAVRRVLDGVKKSDQPVVLVSHFRVLKAVEAWIQAGCVDNNTDLKTFLKHDVFPGAVIELTPSAGKWDFHVIDRGTDRKKGSS